MVPWGRTISLTTYIKTVLACLNVHSYLTDNPVWKCMDSKKHRYCAVSSLFMNSNLNEQNTEISLSMHSTGNPPPLGAQSCLNMFLSHTTEARVLNVYTLSPCPVSCYVIAINALVCLHMDYKEEGDIGKLGLDIISTKNKTCGHPLSN